jgi:integrase
MSIGTPLDASNLRRMLRKSVGQVGVAWVTPHTFASMLFAEGRNAKQVAAWLAHRDSACASRHVHSLLDDGLAGEDFLDGLVPTRERVRTTHEGGSPSRTRRAGPARR